MTDHHIPTLTTERLIMRPFTEADVDPLHRILNHGQVLRYFPGSDSADRERVARIIARQREQWSTYDYGWWALEWRDRPGLLGWCGLQYLPETAETEVGYLLGKPHWGQGLATEAARASVRFGFEDFPLDFIVGIVHPENIASQRVLEKTGLGDRQRTRYFEMDCYRYVLTRLTWEETQR